MRDNSALYAFLLYIVLDCLPIQKLNCLLYADDIVLLSETTEELQNSLDKLSRYTVKKKGATLQ